MDGFYFSYIVLKSIWKNSNHLLPTLWEHINYLYIQIPPILLIKTVQPIFPDRHVGFFSLLILLVVSLAGYKSMGHLLYMIAFCRNVIYCVVSHACIYMMHWPLNMYCTLLQYVTEKNEKMIYTRWEGASSSSHEWVFFFLSEKGVEDFNIEILYTEHM